MAELIVYYSVGIAVVFCTAFFAYWATLRYNVRIRRSVLITLIIVSGYLFIAQYLKYRSLHMYVDLSHWLQILHSIVTSGKPESLNQALAVPGTLNYLSVHFVPFIYAFVLFFRLLSRPETLLFLNVAFMLSAAIPLYKLAVVVNGNKRFALLLAVVFLWYPTFQYITLYEFEMLRFSIPVLLWMLYFWEVRKTTLFFLLALTAVLVREEVGLTVAMFGLYVLLVEKKRIKGIAAAILGLGGFFVITQIAMPFFSTAENFQHVAVAGSFSQFGGTPIEMIKGIVTHPKLLLATIMHSVKFANIGMLLLPLLFIPLFAPTALIGALANIGVGLVSYSLVHTSYMLYYVAPSVPFIFYAFIKAWPRLMNVIAKPKAVAISDDSTPLTTGIASSASRNDRIEQAAMVAVLAGMLTTNIFFGPSPISLQFWFKNIQPAPFKTQDFHWSVYRFTDHHRKVAKFVDMIPNDAIVSAQAFLQPRLYRKKGVMDFPQIESKDGRYKAEYIFIDRTNNRLKSESPAYLSEDEIDAITKNTEWTLVASDDSYELYRKRGNKPL